MGTLQREGRGGMIEEVGNPVPAHPVPTLRHMATVTPPCHTTPVGIAMAGKAIGSIQWPKDHNFPSHAIGFLLMAAAARHVLMEPLEWVSGLRMVERGCLTPALFIMTGTARASRKLLSVRVL